MKIVLDSCLLIAFLRKEKNWEKVKEYLEKAESGEVEIYSSWLNLVEVYYKIFRKQGQAKADKTLSILKELPIEIILPDEEFYLSVGRIKGKYPIALVDCFCVALAERFDAKIATGDPEFKQIEDKYEFLWLPAS